MHRFLNPSRNVSQRPYRCPSRKPRANRQKGKQDPKSVQATQKQRANQKANAVRKRRAKGKTNAKQRKLGLAPRARKAEKPRWPRRTRSSANSEKRARPASARSPSTRATGRYSSRFSRRPASRSRWSRSPDL